MNLNSILSRRSALVRGVLPAALIALLGFASILPAGSCFLETNRPDGIALLPPPPTPGTAEYDADLATVRAVFKGRTSQQKKDADKSSSLSIFNFAEAIGPGFQAGKFPKTEALFTNVRTNISDVI